MNSRVPSPLPQVNVGASYNSPATEEPTAEEIEKIEEPQPLSAGELDRIRARRRHERRCYVLRRDGSLSRQGVS
jgi:hypothetical protein